MPEWELDPRSTIDRNAEQELFANLVSFVTPARMLVISDKLDRGKSTLLRRLQYNCEMVIKPPVPVCLVDLANLPEAAPIAFVEKIVSELKIDDRFPKYIPFKNARAAKNFDPFDTSGAGMFGQVTAKGQIGTGGGAYVGGNVNTGGGEFAGRDSYKGAIVVQNIARGEFDDGQEEIARKRCIEAFFEDLRVLCATQPIVVLLDHWENCNYDLQKWIRNTFMREHCFHHDKNLRPDKLAVVVAGNTFDEAEVKFGIRDKEFSDLFKDDEEYDVTVKSKASLSEWTNDHIRAFLKQNGFVKNVSDEDIDYLRGCVKRGMTFSQIRDISKTISSANK